METKKDDFRAELESIIDEIQRQIVSMRQERERIDEKLRDADSALASLRSVYDIQSRRLGETRARFWGREGAPSRFTGMRLIDALALVRKEQPRISKREACKILEKEGFTFRTNRHLSAVHFAWIALDRRKEKK